MKASDFKVGDRVIVSEFKPNGISYKNEKAKVVAVLSGKIVLEFHNHVEGYSGGGLGKNGYCLFFYDIDMSDYFSISKIKKLDNFKKLKKLIQDV